MKTSAASNFTVGGPTLAAHAFNAGLADESHLFICPVLVGRGKPAFPSDARAQLELLEEHRFGTVSCTCATAPTTDESEAPAESSGAWPRC
jgi:dihydrofolate reductase